MPTKQVVREYHAPFSRATLRALQGEVCIDCEARCPLRPAGSALSHGPGKEVTRWNVRRCERCAQAAR